MDREPIGGDIRGMGLMWGLEFVRDKATKLPFDPDVRLARRVMMRSLKNGIVIYPVSGYEDGRAGGGILICPPLVIKAEGSNFWLRNSEIHWVQ